MKLMFEKLIKLFENRKIVVIIFAIFFVLIIVLGLVQPKCDTGDKIVAITKGLGSDETAQVLKNNGIINSKWEFVFYLWIKGYINHIQAGEYLLNSRMTMPQVARIIVNGEINQNYVKVTIPEGWDTKKIEARLRENKIIDNSARISIDNEGYLFPDTYYFYKNSSLDTVIQKMKDNFNNKIDNGLIKEIKNQGKTLYDILKIASILEREVVSDEDRAIVSGIFWKRIKLGMPLQADITIAYVLGIDKWQYSSEDIKIKSPYNTYVNLGLPPTPICNPGLSAIKAAIYPKQTDYLYFLSTLDGRTVYSKTLEEHNRNKAKYL